MLPTYEQESVFGEVVHLFPMEDKNVLLAFLRIVNVKYFDDQFYSYVVKKTDEYKLVKIP